MLRAPDCQVRVIRRCVSCAHAPDDCSALGGGVPEEIDAAFPHPAIRRSGGRPVTVEELADGLGGRVPRSDAASTYRNLETLEDLGLVRHMHLGHGAGRYA